MEKLKRKSKKELSLADTMQWKRAICLISSSPLCFIVWWLNTKLPEPEAHMCAKSLNTLQNWEKFTQEFVWENTFSFRLVYSLPLTCAQWAEKSLHFTDYTTPSITITVNPMSSFFLTKVQGSSYQQTGSYSLQWILMLHRFCALFYLIWIPDKQHRVQMKMSWDQRSEKSHFNMKKSFETWHFCILCHHNGNTK